MVRHTAYITGRRFIVFKFIKHFEILMQVSEILDSELLGEGLIPTLQHAHDMLLVENAKTVPYRATTYGQVLDHAFFEVFRHFPLSRLRKNWSN